LYSGLYTLPAVGKEHRRRIENKKNRFFLLDESGNLGFIKSPDASLRGAFDRSLGGAAG
jgi:hypothetical protein